MTAAGVCFGTSGAVTKISHGRKWRVLKGVPSIGDGGGGWLLRASRHGVRQVADIAGFEGRVNPDGGQPPGDEEPDADRADLGRARPGRAYYVGRPGRVVAGAGRTIPGGLAIRGSTAYESNCGTSAGTGSIVRIPLR